MRKSFIQHAARLCAVLILASFPTLAAAADARVVLENRTWSPLHYRGQSPQGTRQTWQVLLPGASVEYAPERLRSLEVWFDAKRSEQYQVRAGNVYALHRRSPRGRTEFSLFRTRQRPAPSPPGRPLYGEDPFAPLERFIATCEDRRLEYRLSLRELARDCEAAQKKGPLPAELRFLRGFTWFVGFMIDTESQDVILLGIQDPTRPPIDVDSLVAVIKAVTAGQVPYCSLEEHLISKYQKSIVAGVPWQSRFAEVMIQADYDMGRTFQGMARPHVPGFKSHIDHFADVMSTLGEGPEQIGAGRGTANRWWFNFDSATTRAVADSSGQLVYLHANPVQLSTEAKINGAFGTGLQSLSAVRFAEQFTRHLDALGKEYPSIAELQALFRLYDLMRHVHEVGRAAVPGQDYWLSQYRHPYAGPPETMPAWPKVTRTIRTRKEAPRFLPGSTFVGTEDRPGHGRLRFDLFTGRRVTLQDAHETRHGTWELSGDQIIMRFNSGRLVYVGSRLNNGVVGGAANGHSTWIWTTDQGYETQSWTFGRVAGR